MTSSWPASRSVAYAASSTEELNQVFSGPLTSRPTRPSRPVASAEAVRESAKSSSDAADRTRSRVAGEMRGESRSARETVDVDTPARAATSSMVAGAAAVVTGPWCTLGRRACKRLQIIGRL